MASTAEKTIDFMTKLLEIISGGLEGFSKFMATMGQNIKNEKEINFFRDYMKNDGNVVMYPVNAFEGNLWNQLIEKLNNAKGVDGKSLHFMASENPSFICTREQDVEVIKEIEKELYRENKRVTMISADDFMKIQNNRPISEVTLTKSELDQFQKIAKKDKYNRDCAFIFTAQKKEGEYKNDEPVYSVYVDRDANGKKTLDIINEVALKNTGIIGQVENARTKANEEIIKNIYKYAQGKDLNEIGISAEDLANGNDEFYVGSASDPSFLMHITVEPGNNTFEIERIGDDPNGLDDKVMQHVEEKILKDNDEFSKEMYFAASAISNPVILTSAEFEDFSNLSHNDAKEALHNSVKSKRGTIEAKNRTNKSIKIRQEEKVLRQELNNFLKQPGNSYNMLFNSNQKDDFISDLGDKFVDEIAEKYDDIDKDFIRQQLTEFNARRTHIGQTFVNNVDIHDIQLGEQSIESLIDQYDNAHYTQQQREPRGRF